MGDLEEYRAGYHILTTGSGGGGGGGEGGVEVSRLSSRVVHFTQSFVQLSKSLVDEAIQNGDKIFTGGK